MEQLKLFNNTQEIHDKLNRIILTQIDIIKKGETTTKVLYKPTTGSASEYNIPNAHISLYRINDDTFAFSLNLSDVFSSFSTNFEMVKIYIDETKCDTSNINDEDGTPVSVYFMIENQVVSIIYDLFSLEFGQDVNGFFIYLFTTREITSTEAQELQSCPTYIKSVFAYKDLL